MNGLLGKFEFPAKSAVPSISFKREGKIFREITGVKFLDGASGGVYALMLAHLPTLIMNWREIKTFFEWIVR